MAKGPKILMDKVCRDSNEILLLIQSHLGIFGYVSCREE